MLGYKVCHIISSLDSTEYHEAEREMCSPPSRAQSSNQVIPDRMIHKILQRCTQICDSNYKWFVVNSNHLRA